jgi:hypothetical protein
MKYMLSYMLYYIGDIISRTTMVWGNGFGYSIYSRIMNLSVNLDTEQKIWKPVKKGRKR